MVYCFAPDCKHSTDTHTCGFWSPPANQKKFSQWESLLRRKDRSLSKSARVCKCHFKDGLKENGPTLFKHNLSRSLNSMESPKKNLITKKRIRPPKKSKPLLLAGDDVQSTSTQEVMQIEESDTSFQATDDVTPGSDLLEEALNRSFRQGITINTLKQENMKLKEGALDNCKLSYELLKDYESKFLSYTGLTVYDFEKLYSLFDGIELNYYQGWAVTRVPRKDQLLLCLMKLRCSSKYFDLSLRFRLTETTISNIFLTWLHALHEKLYVEIYCSYGIPSRFKNQLCLPACFDNYKNCRIVIDCTEIKMQPPRKDLNKQKDLYSYYKSETTFKALLGVAPNGCPTFTSKLYPGSRTDKEIVIHSKLLDHMEQGDCILADKGFLLFDILPPGVSLNTPPFLCTPQFTEDQAIMGEQVSGARGHVERAIKRIKEYEILRCIPAKFREYGTKIWQVCVALQLFNSPIIKEIEGKM